MKTRILCVICFVCASVCYGQKPKDVRIRMVYDIQATDSTKRLRLTILVPGDVEDRQKLNKQTFSIEPDTIYNFGSNRYAGFDFKHLAIPDRVEIESELTIMTSDYKTLQKSAANRTIKAPDSLGPFLRSAPYIDSDDPEVVKVAEYLRDKDRLTMISRIYSYITKNVKYSNTSTKVQNSSLTISTLKGGGRDFSNLMVALCRANSIPARTVYGLASYKSYKLDFHKYTWVEVYLDDIGWVSFDPVPSETATLNTTNKHYIYLFPEGYDEKLTLGYYYYYYNYWGAKPNIKDTFIIE